MRIFTHDPYSEGKHSTDSMVKHNRPRFATSLRFGAFYYPMTPDKARNQLSLIVSREIREWGYFNFPVKDQVVSVNIGEGRIEHVTFIHLIKIAYNLTEAGEQKDQCHG